MAATPATTALDRAGVPYTLHEYRLETEDGPETYGEAVAAALGVRPDRLFKTLLAEIDGSPVVAIVPSSSRLALKALARAAAGKRAGMADPRDAERLTGYVTGGISPFGQRRRLPAFVDATALSHPTVFVSAGRRGLQVEVDPRVLVDLLGCRPTTLTE